MVSFCLCRRCFVSIRAFARKRLDVGSRIEGYVSKQVTVGRKHKSLARPSVGQATLEATRWSSYVSTVDIPATTSTSCYIRCGRSCMGEHQFLRVWYEQQVRQTFQEDFESGYTARQYCIVSTSRMREIKEDEVLRRQDLAVRTLRLEHVPQSKPNPYFEMTSSEASMWRS